MSHFFTSTNLTRHHLTSAALLCAALPLLAGCGRTVSVHDDLDPNGMDLRILEDVPEEDSVHLPYAEGARVTLTPQSSDSDDDACAWTMKSRNPGVFKVVSKEQCGVEFEAVAPGKAIVDVFAPGDADPVDNVHVSVARPDHVVLLAPADISSHHPELGETAHISVVRTDSVFGPPIKFVARAYDHDTRLYGTGIFGAQGNGLHVSTKTTAVNSNEDWVELFSTEAGNKSLTLTVAGAAMPPMSVTVIDRDAIASLDLLDDGRDNPEAGDARYAVAIAKDSAGGRIHGVAYDWSLGGDDAGSGNMFSYEYAPDSKQLLEAQTGKHQAQISVLASRGSGRGGDSQLSGCSYAPGTNANPWAWVVSAIGLGLLAFRRRRATS